MNRSDPNRYERLDSLSDIDPDSLPFGTPANYSFRYIDISSVSGGRLIAPEEKINYKDAPNRARRKIRNGDVLMSTVRPNLKAFAYCELPDDDFVASTGFALIRPKLQSDGLYILQCLLSSPVLRQIDSLTVGSNYPAINNSDVKRLLIPKLEPCIRKKIGAVFRIFDRAIERTEALVHKYQQIKAGLMHDLFSRGLAADGKLRPPREQAPELYRETPIGWIPKEWDWGPLSTYINGSPKNGYSPSEIDAWDGCASLGLGCLTHFGFRAIQLKIIAKRTALSSGALLKDGDFLVSRANTPQLVGLCGVYKDIGCPCIYPDLMMRIQPNAFVHSKYLEQYLLSAGVRIRLTAMAVGTSMSMVKLNSKSIMSFAIAVPPIEEQERIFHRSDAIDRHLKMLTNDLAKLRQGKAGLMHDLLTGTVEVKTDPAEAATISQ